MGPDNTDSFISNRRQSNRIEISYQASSSSPSISSIEEACKPYGTVKKVQHVANAEQPYFTVIFDTPEEANIASTMLNTSHLNGSELSVKLANHNPASSLSKINNHRSGTKGLEGHNRVSNGASSAAGCPLRILVPSEYVGAIIGRKGQTIKNITQKCKARVDVHGKGSNNDFDKINDKVVISIYGQADNCTNACKEILNVLQQEAVVNNKGEVFLKMLANDRFCGRIIGKDGKVIKKIKEDSNTHITVSNSQETSDLYPDRVIAIKGGVEGMSQAQSAISAKLAECILQAQQQSFVSNGLMSTPFSSDCYPSGNPLFEGFHSGYMHPGMYPPFHRPLNSRRSLPPSFEVSQNTANAFLHNEVLHIAVPNQTVGAIIGANGSTIKHMMKYSRAFINIEAKKDQNKAAVASSTQERNVVVKGTPEACWKAAYFVFEKMRMELSMAGHAEVQLRTSIEVPSNLVGRLIGRSGRNVKELQRLTGTLVKLPFNHKLNGEVKGGDDGDIKKSIGDGDIKKSIGDGDHNNASNGSHDKQGKKDMVSVEIFGNYIATRDAVSKIRNIMLHGGALVPPLYPCMPPFMPPFSRYYRLGADGKKRKIKNLKDKGKINEENKNEEDKTDDNKNPDESINNGDNKTEEDESCTPINTTIYYDANQ